MSHSEPGLGRRPARLGLPAGNVGHRQHRFLERRQPLGGEVFHYRGQTQLEVDAIVDCGERWAGFEVKLGGGTLIDEAAQNLSAFAKGVDTSRRGTPLLLGVIVATGFGYVRPDGVHVIPIGALGP